MKTTISVICSCSPRSVTFKPIRPRVLLRWLTFVSSSERKKLRPMTKLENELNQSGACRLEYRQSSNHLLHVEQCSLPVDFFIISQKNHLDTRPLLVLPCALSSSIFYPWTLEPIVCSFLGKRFIEHALLCRAIRHAHIPTTLQLVSLSSFFFVPGSGTFILLAHLSRIWGGAGHIRQKVQTGLVTTWGLR